MGLSEIAAGVTVTERQDERGVPAVDDTETGLADRLEPHESDLPCDSTVAATVVETYAAGRSVEASAHAAGVPAVTAAKTLHLLGEQVSPLGPRGREIVRDWLQGELARREAVTLTGVGDRTFALAVYVETHDPIPEARDAVEGTLTVDGHAADDPLGEARSDLGDLL